jgi:hypothetical protein
MKTIKVLYIILVSALTFNANAQVGITLNVDANPTPRFADWVNRNELAVMTVTNTNPRLEGLEYKIKVRLSIDNNLVAETDLSKIPSRTLPFGTEVFLADEVIPFSSVTLYSNIQNSIATTGLLPAGVYSFCVSLVDVNNVTISTPQEVCRPLFITSYQQPELIYPHSNVSLDASLLPATEFVWTPMTPSPPADLGVKYVVVITEVLAHQSPSQAFMVNYPLIEQEVIGSNRMLWPVDIDAPSDSTQFVWSVKAVSLDGEPFQAENGGFASFGAFTVAPPAMFAKMAQGPGDEPEEVNLPVQAGELAENDTIYAGLNGEFLIEATDISGANGKFSGKGIAFVNWLNARIEVAFDSIKVDTLKHLIEGKIIAAKHDDAPVYPVDWALEAIANLPFTNQIADNIVSWVENTSGQTIPYNNLNELTNPVKMPVGLVFPDGNELAINEMVFLPEKSEFNMIAAKTVPPSWGTTRLGFRGLNIRFHPSSIEMPPGRIELVEDISIGNVNNKIVMVFKKPDTNHLGCYIEWDEDGFSEYGIELEALFTRDWLIPSPDNDPGAKVAASISANGPEWNDLILGGTLERAEIVGTGGITILADSIYYDFSDVLNPPAITFPENYTGETSELFRGFFMKALEVEMPDAWQTQASTKPKIGVHNMIIDDMGITLLAEATSVLQFPNAKVADLVASIDTVYVDFVASSMVEAGIKGRIGLPVSKKDSIQNPLKYVALFNNPQAPGVPVSFQLAITPTGPVEAHMLKGKLELAQTSNIVASVDKNKSTFNIKLDGKLNWANIKLGPINNVNLGLKFQGLAMNYNSMNSNQLGFNIGSWTFASEQKFLANFPITIDEVKYSMLPPQSGQLLRGKINFDVLFNLSSEIGGMSRMAVEVGIQDNTGGQKFFPQYLGTTIDSINVHANLAAVSIKGNIGFRNEHPVFGNGFVGSLNAEFKSVGIKASALAEFGNTAYQNNNQLYRYWRVEAGVTLPAPGVVFLPGLAFRGFGGGAFYNMESTLTGTTFSFTPKKSALGFRALATMATTPKEDGFNSDIGLLGQFSNSGGLTYIGFTGDFWVGANLTTSSRNKAKVSGNLSAFYNFPDRHFNFTSNVNVNAPPITTPNPANLVLDINGKTNKWFFKFGEPQNLNTVKVFNVNLYEYLMFGNHIPTPNGFTQGFKNAYHGALGHYPGGSIGSGGVGGSTLTGSGFALGIGFMFNHNDQKHLTGNYYLAYQLGAGAELHLSFLNYTGTCAGFNPIGINGWRASGGLGFYGTAGAQVKRIGGNLADKTWNLATLAAGAWIYGEFPNPYYASGAISGHAKIIKIIDVSFHKTFVVGNQCGNAPAGGGVPVAQGDVAADQQEKLIQYVKPSQTYNFPLTEPLAVKFGLTPEEIFDVSEQQANGTILNRTFKMVTTKTLELQAPNGSYSFVTVNTNQNTLGEYLYTTISPLSVPMGKLAAPAAADGINTTTAATTAGKGGSAIQTMAQLAMATTSGDIAMPAINPAATNGASTTSPSKVEGNIATGFQITYPVVPPPPSYGNLPPVPPDPTNNLLANRAYRFTVTATLKEYKNGAWIDALRINGTLVSQTVVKNFNTGPIPPGMVLNMVN